MPKTPFFSDFFVRARQFFPLLLVGLGAFVLRLLLVSKGPYHLDTLYLTVAAEQTLRTGELHCLFGFGYPLMVLLASVFVWGFAVFGITDSVLAVNMTAVVFSSGSVVVFYLWAQQALGRIPALFSALLLSVSPIFLGLSVYGKSHMPSLFFLFLTLCLLWRIGPNPQRRSWFFPGLALGLMGAARFQDMILMIVPVIFAILWRPQEQGPKGSLRERIILSVQVTGFALLVCLLFHLPFVLSSQRASYFGQIGRFWNAGVTSNYLGLVSRQQLLSWVYLIKSLTIAGFISAVLGWVYLLFTNKRLALFLLLWIMVPLLFYGNIRTGSTSRFFVLVLPPLTVCVGALLNRLVVRRGVFRVVVLLFFGNVIFLLFGYMAPKLQFRHQHETLPEFCRWVGRSTSSEAVIIVGDEKLFMKRYAQRQILARPEKFQGYSPQELARFQGQVDALFRDGRSVYITTPALYSHDFKKQFSSFIKKEYAVIPLGQHLYEDWHLGSMRLQVHPFTLYQLWPYDENIHQQ